MSEGQLDLTKLNMNGGTPLWRVKFETVLKMMWATNLGIQSGLS